MDSELLSILRYFGQNRPPRYHEPPQKGWHLILSVAADLIAICFSPMKFLAAYDDRSVLLLSGSHKETEALELLERRIGRIPSDRIRYRKRIPAFSFLAREVFARREVRRFIRSYGYLRRRYDASVGRNFLKCFLYQAAARHCFSRKRPAALIIVSDLGARRIGFARAAAETGGAVIYYQFWEHHRFAPPFHVDYAICLSNAQARIVKQRFNAAIITRKSLEDELSSLEFKPIPKNPVVGIATNRDPYYSNLTKIIKDLRTKYNPAQILYKPHPANESMRVKSLACDIFDKDSKLEEFTQKVDFCICGNTSSIVKILLTGTPCIYLPNIDAGNPDKFGYVRSGILPNVDSTEKLNLTSIETFYSENGSLNTIRHFLSENVYIDPRWDETQHLAKYIGRLKPLTTSGCPNELEELA